MNEPEIRDEYVQGDGVRLHVARAGEGPPVILLHGFPENWRTWRRQIGPLAQAGFSVWAVDLRGYNLSERPPGKSAYHLQRLIGDVAFVVQATGSQRAHLVGHDWGGVIAWAFAGARPELLEKLVILNAPHMRVYLQKVRNSDQMLRSLYVLLFQLPWLAEKLLSAADFLAIRRMFRDTSARRGAYSQEEIEEYVEAFSTPGALTAALNYYRVNFRSNALFQASAARIQAETLVIWGERDPALGVQLLDGLEEVVPRMRVHRIPDAGHWVQNEAPAEVNRAIVGFLRTEPGDA